ncbi:MAG: DUF4157 domain-containing protein [Pseudomonadota bacterium]|nr:DUF4157 domain-containing protein [Pseudomonadota bacterium]
MEPRFGHSFADVRVHADEAASALCDDLSAREAKRGQTRLDLVSPVRFAKKQQMVSDLVFCHAPR